LKNERQCGDEKNECPADAGGSLTLIPDLFLQFAIYCAKALLVGSRQVVTTLRLKVWTFCGFCSPAAQIILEITTKKCKSVLSTSTIWHK